MYSKNWKEKEKKNLLITVYEKFERWKLNWDPKWHLEFIYGRKGILLPELVWHSVRKSCCSDWEKLLKFECDGREFKKNLRSPEQFIQTVKGQNIFWEQNAFFTCF